MGEAPPELQDGSRRESGLTGILDCVPDPVFRWDLREGRLDYCNRAWQDTLGWSPGDLEAMGSRLPVTIIHPDDYDAVVEAGRAAAAPEDGIPQAIEFRVRHEQGHYVWVTMTWGFVRDAEGTVRYAVGTARDSSEWHAVRRALEDSRERYRSLFRDCPIALFEYDASAVRSELDRLAGQDIADVGPHLLARPELLQDLVSRTTVLDANDAAATLLGAKSREDLLVGVDTFFEPESYPAFVGAVAALAGERTRYEAEFPARRPDGQKILVHATVGPAPGHEDTYLRVLAAVRDVTSQRQSEETIRALLNAPNEVILLIDTEGNLLAANDAAAEGLGLSGQELAGRCLFEASAPSVVECRRSIVEQAVRTGRTTHYCEVRPDAVHDITVYPVPGGDGNVERLAIVARNVTEEVANARALEETQRTAAQTVASVPSGLLVYDYEPPDAFRLTEANPAADGITQLRLAEHRGRLFREIWPDSYSLGVTEAYVRVMQTGRSESREMAYHADDGSLSHVFKARVFRLSARRLGVAFEDITAERKAQSALRASEATARALLNAPPESMILTDLDGRILDLNEPAAKRLGASRGELIGKAPADVVEPEVARRRSARIRQVVETGEPVRYEDRRGGYEFDTVMHPVPGPDGSVQHLAIFARDVSELRSAREAAAEAERSAKQLVDAMPAGLRIFRCEPPDLFVLEYENEEAERVHGVPFDEARGRTFRELFPQAHAQGATEPYEEVRRTGDAVERVWIQHDGEGEIDYAAHTHVFALGDDRVGVAFYPVTERLRAEQARQEMEARYRSLVESIPAVAYTAALDPQSTTTYISPQVADLLGYSPEDFVSDPDLWREALHPDDADHVMEAVHESHASGERFSCEYRLRRADGRYVWIRDAAAIVCDADGRPQMLQGVMLDITASREADAALRESEERFRLLVDTAFDGISICEFDRAANKRRLLMCNDRYVEMSGYSRSELEEADDLNKLVVSHATPEERRRHWESIPEGIPIFGVSSWLRPDGRENYYEYTSVFVRKHDDVFLCYGVDRDITERRAADAALLTQREGLRRLNAELSRVEEAERRRIAEGLHDHVGQLLVSVKMRVEALLNRERSPADDELLATIATLAGEAAAATQDLTFELSPPVLHQLGLVPALEWLSDHAAKTRGLDVEVKAANGRAELPEDMAVLLFRSVSELLNNVAKHANTSHATVSMQVGEGEAVLVVSDEGEGFDPGLGDQTGRRAGGFGLFSVRERLKAVGGDVEIESRRGLGTRVTLRIPLSTS